MVGFPQYYADPQQMHRPPPAGSTLAGQDFTIPIPNQFRPVAHTQQPPPEFIPPSIQQFHPVGHASNILPPQNLTPHFPESIQQLVPRPGQPGQGPISSQANHMPYVQQNLHLPPGSMQGHHNSQLQLFKLGDGGMPTSSSYTFSTSYGQQPNDVDNPSQYHPMSQIQPSVRSVEGHWLAPGGQNAPSVTASVQAVQHSSAPPLASSTTELAQLSSDWQEHTSSDGRRYYYNKKTKQSSWLKPVELMTPVERADASTAWKEYTTPEGRKYFYNKVTKQSKWTIPDEVKFAREQAERGGIQPAKVESIAASLVPAATSPPSFEVPTSTASTTDSAPVTSVPVASSPFPVNIDVSSVNPLGMKASVSPSIAATPSAGIPSNPLLGSTNMLNISTPATPLPASSVVVNDITDTTEKTTKSNDESISFSNVGDGPDIASQDLDEVKKDNTSVVKSNLSPLEEKPILEEPMIYANKTEAKNAFKCLLESSNVESDWTWEQAMRVIINDKRYGALKTLGERKHAFNEYLGERKKKELEDRRIKQKKEREDFLKMLEESQELASSTKWSKAVIMFEDDERFNAIERMRDREDLFEAYMVELRKKKKAKAAEEHKRNVMEYKSFLESCDFIKANSQWRKVQDRLEDDERCSRLDKFDRLKIFQDYINELEKEEEELMKIQKEKMRKEERKNRDEFRKLMEQHVAAGILTTKTHWRDYYMEVKDLPSYLAVSSNTSGATPKDLFEDVAEELEKQFGDDKRRIKDALKIRNIALTSSSSYEIFKATTSEDGSLGGISEVNLKLIFDELLEKLKDKEEKEAKRCQRLADRFSNMLYSVKEISASSTWEECKSLFDDCQYSWISGEEFMRETFEKYVAHLQEKSIEKERKRDEGKVKKEKGRSDKEKDKNVKGRGQEKEKGKRQPGKDEMDLENGIDSSSLDDRRGKDKDRRRKKHDHDAREDENAWKDKKEKSKKSRRHSSDHNHDAQDDENAGKDEKDKSKKSRRQDSDHDHDAGDDQIAWKDEKENKKSRRHSSDRKRSRKV